MSSFDVTRLEGKIEHQAFFKKNYISRIKTIKNSLDTTSTKIRMTFPIKKTYVNYGLIFLNLCLSYFPVRSYPVIR